MLFRSDVVEAGADRARHGVQGLAGGVRHQVDVEVGGEPGWLGVWHGGFQRGLRPSLLGMVPVDTLLAKPQALGDSIDEPWPEMAARRIAGMDQ